MEASAIPNITVGHAHTTAALLNGSEGRTMTPGQCREARGLLRWSRYELGQAADVPLWFVAQFEDGTLEAEFLAHWETSLREALEDAGARFPIEIACGQPRPARVYLSARDQGELN